MRSPTVASQGVGSERLRMACVLLALGLFGALLLIASMLRPATADALAGTLLLLAASAIAAPLFKTSVDPFGPATLFMSIYALATLSAPMSAVFFDSGRDLRRVNETLALATLGAIFFWVGRYLASRLGMEAADSRERTAVFRQAGEHSHLITVAGYALVVCGLVLLLSLFHLVGGYAMFAEVGWLEKRRLTIGLGPAAYGTVLLQAGATMLFVQSFSREGQPRLSARLLVAASTLALLVLLAFMSGQRRGMVFPVASFAFAYHLVVRPIPIRRYIVPLILAAAFLSSFSHFRGLIGPSERADALDYVRANATAEWLDPSRGYFGASHDNLVLMLDHAGESMPFRFGASYVGAPLQWIPVAIYPDRPLSPTEILAKKFYPGDYVRGGGRGFSILAEAYWNFGPVGVPIAFTLAGFLMSAAYFHVLHRTRTLGRLAYATAAPFFVLMLVTIDFASSLKFLILALAPFVMVRLVAAARN